MVEAWYYWSMTHYDIIIHNGLLLPQAGEALTNNGSIGITNGFIKRIAAADEKLSACSATTTIDAKGQLICPGLINAHGHSAMTLFRGLADDLPLMDWLQNHIFPAEATHVNPEMVYWCSKLAAAEMILSGTTCVADSYFFESEAVKAFIDSGIRSVAAQGIIDFPAPGVPDPTNNIIAAQEYLRNFPNHPLSSKALFCHSPYTCSPNTLCKAKELATDNDCLLFIHAAETEAEVIQINKTYGTTPIRHLYDLGILDDRTVCVHCIAISEEEITLLQRSGSAVVTCPESNMKLASGAAPIHRLRQAGVPVALGTDGCASNNDLDLFSEMGSLARLHKLINSDPTVMKASETFASATSSGAKALGLTDLGTLQPGQRADLILLDINQPHLTPFYNPDNLVYCAKGSDVVTSIINGKLVMQGRKLLSIDVAETIEQVRKLSATVLPLSKGIRDE